MKIQYALSCKYVRSHPFCAVYWTSFMLLLFVVFSLFICRFSVPCALGFLPPVTQFAYCAVDCAVARFTPVREFLLPLTTFYQQ